MNPFDQIPPVDFVPKSVDRLLEEMVADYEAEYYRQTGVKKTVLPASEERIQIYTEAARFYTAYQLIDYGCKMNLLKYAQGPFLDNLAALFGLSRLPAQPSLSRARFTLSAPQAKVVVIPKGTRLASPGKLYFETVEEVLIPPGQEQGEVNLVSLETGAATAGLLAGQLDLLVDPIPFVAQAVNLTPTQGGADRETDDHLRLRVYQFGDSYSTAGPEDAYRYFVREYSQAVEGISVHSPEPGEVDIRVTLTGGELPLAPFLDGLTDYLETRRPLTDRLTISPPDPVEYRVDCVYYVARSARGRLEEIRARVAAAVEAYTAWQDGEIGRDISPDMLTKLVMEAGAKRAPVTSPAFTPIDHRSICRHGQVDVVFGGIEDD